MITITTELAPAAKPIPKSLELTTDWQIMLECPQYDVPESGFGNQRRIAPAVIEISSPIIAACIGENSTYIDIRIVREGGVEVTILNNRFVPANDPLLVPMNGTMLLSGDTLEIKASDAGRVHATISATVGQAEEDSAL